MNLKVFAYSELKEGKQRTRSITIRKDLSTFGFSFHLFLRHQYSSHDDARPCMCRLLRRNCTAKKSSGRSARYIWLTNAESPIAQ